MTVVEKEWVFPAGERGVRVKTDMFTESCTVDLHFKGSDSLIDMLLTVDALRRQYGKYFKISLNTPYFPYARQDRRMQEGESHSLKVIADLVNSCGFSEVCTVDPHSDVVEAVVNNLKIIPQHEAAIQVLPDIAMKATYVEINGKGNAIFKEPKTDDGTKKSAKGLLKVEGYSGNYRLVNNCTKQQEQEGCLQVVYLNGTILRKQNFADIRTRLGTF